MSWFLAAIYDRFMRSAETTILGPWRRELLDGIEGEVLEVGAGTGANLPHYPERVTRLVLTEPDRAMRRRLERRLAVEAGVRGRPFASVHPDDVPLERLPFDAGRFDAVVATLVLCSVGDPIRSIAEIRRVLRPGGRFVFLEHVAAEDRPARLRWQRRIEPLWRRVSGNCHLTRRTEAAILDAGFTPEWIKRESMRRALPIVRATVRGIARLPAPGAQ